ncbi:MAG: hypothetical protein Rubg2KO_05400 [Rubricoccaceae bacterium]
MIRFSRLLALALATLLVAPAALAQFNATNGLTSSTPTPEAHVELTWTATGAAGELYQISRARIVAGVPQTEQVLAVQPETSTEYLDTSARPDVEYRYCLTPQSTGTASCANGARKLRRPATLTASDSTRIDGITLTWVDASSVELGYVVYRGAPGAAPNTLTAIDTTTADATGYLDIDVDPLQATQYCVGLLDGSGGVATATPDVCDVGTRGVVLPPAGVIASDGQFNDRIRVAWATRSGVSYTVYRDGVLLASPLTGPSYDDPTAVDGTIYTYCVTATNAEGESVASCDTGQRGGLAFPDSLQVSNGTSDSAVELAWNDPGLTETGFRIYRQRALPEGGPRELVAELAASRTRYSDTSGEPGWTYDYAVAAIATVDDVTVESELRWGLNVGRRAILLAPTAFAASDSVTTHEAYTELTWESASDVVQLFQVLRDGTPIATLAPFMRSYQDKTALSGTTYDYAVRSVAVIGVDTDALTQGLSPLLTRAQAQRDALDADRTQARDADALARVEERADALETTLVSDVQAILADLGIDAASLASSSPAVASASSTSEVHYASSEVDAGTRLLLAPTNLAGSTDTEDRIRLAWTDNSGIETYYQIRAIYSPTDSAEVFIGPNRATWIDLDAPAGTDVRYRLRAIDGRDLSNVNSISAWAEATVRRDLLPPGNLQARQDGIETELLVTWRDSSRAETGYVVTTQLAAAIFSQTTEANARQIRIPIQPEDFGRPTTINILAVDSTTALVGAASQSVAVAVTVTPTLLAPSVVTASTEYPDQVVVSWTDDSDANEAYTVTRDGTLISSFTMDATTFIDTAPTGPARYCVTPTRTGSPAASPDPVCARGRPSTVTVPSTGDVVTTPRYSSNLNSIPSAPGFGSGASYGRAVAASGANAVGSTDVDALTLSQGIAPGWAIPWRDNNGTFDYGSGGYSNGTVKGRVGMAAFYERFESGWAEISRIQISPSDGFTYGSFGYDVDLDGDVAIIGAPGPATYVTHPRQEASAVGVTRYQTEVTFGDGGAYIYTKNGSGDWVRSKLLRFPGFGDNQFATQETGYQIGLSDGGCILNAELTPGRAENLLVGGHTSSRCRPYYRTAGGSFLSAAPVDRTYTTPIFNMGTHVALTPHWAFVAYVIDGVQWVGRFQASNNWAYVDRLAPPPGFLPANSITALAASPTALAVGAGNRVHLHSVTPGDVTTDPVVINPPEDLGFDQRFGSSVDVEGDLLVIGASGSHSAANGRAHIYRNTGGFTWTWEATLVASDPDRGFGHSTKIAGQTIAVSAVATNGPGFVYTFRRQDDGTWAQVARLVRDGAGPNDQAYFGYDLSATGEDLVIGAPATSTPDGVTGAVYIATLSTPPRAVEASDGRYANRVQIRWDDQAANEDGHRIYRRGPTDEKYELVGTVDPNVEVFDDFDIAPGDAYGYCVASFLGEDESDTNPLGESARTCDAGYTPPNGTIAGRLETSEGAGVIGTPVCLAPGPDQALMFDGLAGRAIAARFGALPDAFTLEAWVHTSSIEADTSPIVGIDGNTFAMLQLGGTGTPTQVRLRAQSASLSETIDGPVLEPGWHHLAATHDGNALALYVDGQPAGSVQFVSSSIASGAFQIASDAAGNTYKGRIDDVRLWSTAMTAADVEDSYDAALPLLGDEPDLYAYWAADQGAGRVLTDLSDGGRHAFLEGGAEWTDAGAPLNTCTVSDTDGNYTFTGLRYGERKAFRVTPTDSTRQFTPATKTATLTPESPTENQLDFIDTSAFTVRGRVFHAVDQNVWGGAQRLPAPGVEIFVDGAVAATTENDGTFSVAVRGVRQHVFEARADSLGLAFTATFGEQDFDDGTARLVTNGDLEGLEFTNTTQHVLRGQAAGGCMRSIGPLKFRITTEDRAFDQMFTTDGAAPYALPLPPLAYRLEFESLLAIPSSLDAASVIDFFRNLGVLRADLTTAKADTVDFRYRAPITLAIGNLPATSCTDGYTVVDADDVERQTIPGVPVLSEYSRPTLAIRAFEDYGDPTDPNDDAVTHCPVDEGTLRIFDGFADATDTPVELALEDGVAEYKTFARSPDTFAGRTVDGVDRSYQKSLSAVLEVPDGPSVTETVWAIVEGYREKPATFVTATMSEIPVMILRDPPGTESSAFVEKDTKSCVAFSQMNVTNVSSGVGTEIKAGFKTTVGFGISVDNGGGLHFKNETLFGVGTSATTGPPESNMQVCATTTKRWETRGDPGWSGEDLYAGVGLNVLFAETDEVRATQACEVKLSTGLGAGFDPENPFNTTYVYGRTHIQETLVPSLESLARLAGDSTAVGSDASQAVTLRRAIDNWEDMIVYDSTLVAAALDGEVENRSFSGGTTYQFGSARDTTWTSSFDRKVFFSNKTGIGAAFTITGYDSVVDALINVDTEQTFGQSSSTENTHNVGYTLSDSDAGDSFTVDVARDPVYGTYVFNTISGASSNPWEPNTQKRDLPQLEIDPPSRDGVFEGEKAVFTLSLTNASESEDRREYVIEAPPHLNPDGATIKVNGGVLSTKRYLVDPGQTISIPVTVERGPRADDYELAIVAYSPFEHAIWTTAPQLGLANADTVRFEATFTPLVAPVRLVTPEDGWAVTIDNPSVQLVLGDLDIEGTEQEEVGVEYRRANGPWATGFFVKGNEITGTSVDSVWTPPAAIADGPYELRAYAKRSGVGAPLPYVGPTFPGWIDRTRPTLFGQPEPADVLLSLGETVGVAFEEPVDCVGLQRDLADGLTLAVIEPESGLPPALQVGCVDRTVLLSPADASAWADLEGQLVTARIKGVRDLAGNPMASTGSDPNWDQTWQFTVRRNAFGWTPAVVAVRAQPGVRAELPAALVNGRAQPVDFELVAHNATGLPFTFTQIDPATGDPITGGETVALTTSTLSGTVVSGNVQPLAFRWPGAAEGTYRGTVEVESRERGAVLGRSPIEMTVEVACKAPAWAINPAAFENSMTLMADLRMADASSSDTADSLAAFVGGEIRGVASVQMLTASGSSVGRVPLTIYGTGAAERVTFQAWDASDCALHTSSSQVIEFASDATLGTVVDPFVIEAPGGGGAPLSVPLASGWTWVSTNRSGTSTLQSALAGVGQVDTDVVQSQGPFAFYTPGTGWQGPLADLGFAPGQGYRVRLASEATMLHPGALVDPTTPLPVTFGWNWIGFLPDTTLSVADALASLSLATNDEIKSKTAFAQYEEGTGWEGSLDVMEPGVGYQLFLQEDGTLIYPASSSTRTSRALAEAEALRARPVRRMDTLPARALAAERQGVSIVPVPAASSSNPVAPPPTATAKRGALSGIVSEIMSAYEHSMTLTATVDANVPRLHIAAYVKTDDGEALRGLARVQTVESRGDTRAYLLIAGDGAEETIRLRGVTVADDGTLTPVEGPLSLRIGDGPTEPSVPFQSDGTIGTAASPVAIAHTETASGSEIPLEVGLANARPNPASGPTLLEYGLPEAARVRLVVYDVLGREVAVLVDDDRPAGVHSLRFDSRELAAGTYVLRLITGEEMRIRKLTIAR